MSLVKDGTRRLVEVTITNKWCACSHHYSDIRWNGWELCPGYKSAFIFPPMAYAIALNRIRNAVQALDWIIQINGKDSPSWAAASPGFVNAIQHVFNPQGTICTRGCMGKLTGKTLTIRQIDALVHDFCETVSMEEGR